MPLTRHDLAAIPSYRPGRNPDDLARELGLPEAIKLASNEVPFGPLPGVPEAVAAASLHTHRYPDLGVLALRDELSKKHGIDPARITPGCGSVALCEHLVKATALPGDEVIYSWRSFEAYPLIVTGAGITPVQVPNTPDHRHDLNAMADAITNRTRLIFVCSPNNPTGTAVHNDDLREFLARVPKDVLVVLDEAYHEFITDPDVPDGLELLGEHLNLVVLRTFSKAWGLAGLRIGWLAAHEDVADTVRKIVTLFSVSAAAQAGALAALHQAEEVRRRVAIVVSERARISDALRDWVPGIPDSQANFVWLPLGEHSAQFGANCEQRGVIVRPMAGSGVRVTVGTPEENDAFLNVASELLAP